MHLQTILQEDPSGSALLYVRLDVHCHSAAVALVQYVSGCSVLGQFQAALGSTAPTAKHVGWGGYLFVPPAG